MAQKTIEMSQLKQIQQLRQHGVAIKEIARRIGISRNTVKKYLQRTQNTSLPDEGAVEITDNQLATIAFEKERTPVDTQQDQNLTEHFEYARTELHKTGVNRQILWMEYLEKYPDGYKYSQYCNLLKKFLNNKDYAFHRDYKPSEFAQVDFAGKTLSYINHLKEVIKCQVFVACLPYSGLIFCFAVHSQKTQDFVTSINELIKYIGGLLRTFLCDNLKTAVVKSDLYEPIFTEICYQLSDHYHTTFSATRPARPRDKSAVEKSVDIVYTNIYAPMRKKNPGSLEELNIYIAEFLKVLNHKPFNGGPQSRMELFLRDEYPLLGELPQTPYLFKKCKKVTVQRNYFIQLPDNKHYYSVPHQHVGHKVMVHFNQRTVEVYYSYERIAFHVRSSTEPKYNRINEHMPSNHQHMVEAQGWTTEELLQRAQKVGSYTLQAAKRIIHSSFYPEQNYKACNAMICLQHKYSRPRLEAACRRAANVSRPTLKLITNILLTGLDKKPLLLDLDEKKIPEHKNIRGAEHYR
jgi:transposase